jgi:magnesium transporter
MQQNNDMRKMAAWAGILAVPTMVAAIYGMNFHFMPELNWTWGYPGIMALMVVACLELYFQFRNRNWL